MDKERFPREVIKILKLEGLIQVCKEEDIDLQQFIFLRIGQISLHYNCDVKKGDAFASKLSGTDNPYYVARGLLDSGRLNIQIPDGATHYCLGEKVRIEELYLEHKDNSFSYDNIPIVFLKNR